MSTYGVFRVLYVSVVGGKWESTVLYVEFGPAPILSGSVQITLLPVPID